MFSGIQEILVIVLIIVVIMLVPRLLPRGRHHNVDSAPDARSWLEMPRSIRLAVVLSVLWPAAAAAYFQPWKSDLSLFLVAGICPLVLLWGVIWMKR